MFQQINEDHIFGWHILVIPTSQHLRQEDYEFEASPAYKHWSYLRHILVFVFIHYPSLWYKSYTGLCGSSGSEVLPPSSLTFLLQCCFLSSQTGLDRCGCSCLPENDVLKEPFLHEVSKSWLLTMLESWGPVHRGKAIRFLERGRSLLLWISSLCQRGQLWPDHWT